MLSNHWQRIATTRLYWADVITPEAAGSGGAKASNRKSDPETIRDVSSRLQEDLASRWPEITAKARVRRFAEEIGWTPTRAKDVYYGDTRVSLRAFEQNEIDLWFDQQKEAKA